MRSWLIFVCLMLCGCSTAKAVRTIPLLDDSLFSPVTVKIDRASIMELSPEMRAYVETHVRGHPSERDARRALVDALYNQSGLKLDYEGGVTRTAAQAFHERKGNCLSLVLMTAALAKALDLGVEYRKVVVEEVWSRENDLFFASGHVNLSLGRGPRRPLEQDRGKSDLIVDFVSAEEMRKQRVHVIGERTLLAMFMNNRAAEELALDRFEDAYAWVKAALTEDPYYYDAYNTLGIVYLRAGYARQAERVLRTVLSKEPKNTKVISNLIHTLRRLGQRREAEAFAEELARLAPIRPFQLFDRGIEEMAKGHYERARELFEQEIERESSYHEFYFWLALANFGLGNLDEARTDSNIRAGYLPLYFDILDRGVERL